MKNLVTNIGDENVLRPYTRDEIVGLEAAIRSIPGHQFDFTGNTKHHFAGGVYVRELFLPAGMVAVGKIHRHEHFTIILSGTVQFTTDEGIETITGPRILISKPGSKKAAYTITDTVMLNIHPTESTDLEEIEKEFIAPDFEALESEETLCLG